MYSHEVMLKEKGDSKTYDIGLYKTHYFMKKKLVDVVNDIPKYEDAVTLSQILDSALKNGMKIACEELNKEAKKHWWQRKGENNG